MSTDPIQNVPPSLGAKLGNSVGLKLFLIVALTLCFLVPLFMLSGLTSERESRRGQAIQEASAAWAPDLVLATPQILLPYDHRSTDSQGKVHIEVRNILLNPEDFSVKATLAPTIRTVGIFRIPLFSVDAQLSGTFVGPTLSDLGPHAVWIHWEKATFVQALPSWSSLSRPGTLTIDGKSVPPNQAPAYVRLSRPAIATAIDSIAWRGNEISFGLSLSLKGSESFSVVPRARLTTVSIESTWSSPGFFGRALPERRTISEAGMSAEWIVMQSAGMRFGTVEETTVPGEIDIGSALSEENEYASRSGFGFRLYQSGTVYQMTDRALKYGVLFILIPFLGLFLFENLRRKRVHPLQYVLVGLTNTVFYLLLLAVSEHLSFSIAYILAAGVVTCLVAWYAGQILSRWVDGLCMAGILGALYVYMFFALRSEDYALLIGSIGLLVLLATTMILTRKVDWYALGKAKPASE